MSKLINLLMIVVTLTACQPKPDQKKNSSSPASSQYKGNISLVVKAGSAVYNGIPNFTWYNAAGKEISFAEFSKGKPVLINFWATWCGPCVRETPDLVELHNELKSKGALFIGISADLGDDAMELVNDFVKEYKVPYQIVIDDKGELQQAIGGLRGYPTTFYLDKNGKIVKTFLGMQPKQKFAEAFKAIL